MLVNKELSQEIYDEAGEARVFRAKKYIEQARVEIKQVTYDDENNFEVSGFVDANYDEYNVFLTFKCQRYVVFTN